VQPTEAPAIEKEAPQPAVRASRVPRIVNVQLSGPALAIIALGFVAVWAIFNLWEVIVVIAAAFIFMAAALPYVDWLVRRGLNRTAAVLVLLFGILVVLGGLAVLVVPAVVEEGRRVHDQLPDYGRRLDETLADYDIDANLEQRGREFELEDVVSGRLAVDFGQRAFILVLSLLTVIAVTSYLLVDAPRVSEFLYQFVEPGREPKVQAFLSDLRTVVGGYVRGQAITSVVIAAYTAGVMFATGLPNALAFGVLAAFADLLPLIGATLAIAPAVLIALDESVEKAAIVLVALIAYQQFEDRFLTPRVYGSTLNLPPIIVLVAVLVGAKLFGVTGVLLALPATAASRVVLDYYLKNRRWSVNAGAAEGDAFAPDQDQTSEEVSR
jgi:predicted PurR-regulated permease PerM